MKKTFTTKNIAGIAIFSALAFIVYLLDFPIFPAVDFLKLDFSNVFVLLGGFMYGPIGGIIVLVVKELIHIPIGHTTGVGEFANILMGLSFLLLPTIVYLKKKGIKAVVITLLIASVIAVGCSLLVNKFILFPFYDKVANIYDSGLTFDSVKGYIALFNVIKHITVSVLTFLLYKRLSYLFKKINLQEKDTNDIINGEIISDSEKQTQDIAYNFAKRLKTGDVVLLSGELGAGKTAFMKGVCKFFNLSGVTSPTYAYLNVYGDYIYHYDCYRLSCGEDAVRLGLTDYFNGNNICFIEWSENIKDVLPENCKKVEILKLGKNKRKIIL